MHTHTGTHTHMHTHTYIRTHIYRIIAICTHTHQGWIQDFYEGGSSCINVFKVRAKILKPRPFSGKNTPICVCILQLQISRPWKFHEGEQKHKSGLTPEGGVHPNPPNPTWIRPCTHTHTHTHTHTQTHTHTLTHIHTCTRTHIHSVIAIHTHTHTHTHTHKHIHKQLIHSYRGWSRNFTRWVAAVLMWLCWCIWWVAS